MNAGILLLCAAYVLSQFYRSFLAVLTVALETDVGTTPEDLANASGLWFLAFALMQIPVGWALDKVGPRLTSGVLLLIGGAGGAALFGLAGIAAGVRSGLEINLFGLVSGFDIARPALKIAGFGRVGL